MTAGERKIKVLVGKPGECRKSSIVLKEIPSKNYITLIRLNKPVYRPGDTVRFLVLVLDYDTKPYEFNELTVDVLNSRNITLKSFTSKSKDYKFNSTIEIPDEANVGEWKFHVRVNGDSIITEKSIHIENEPKRRVGIFIEAPSKVSIRHREFSVNIFAKHFTGVYASGDAEVHAEFFSTYLKLVLSKKIFNLKLNGRTNQLTINFERDFDVNSLIVDSKINIKVKFIDSLSKSTYEDSITIDFLSGGKYEIKHNGHQFLPGFDRALTVRVYTLDGHHITNKAMKVSMEAKYSNSDVLHLKDGILKNGEVKLMLNPTKEATDISVKLTVDDTEKVFRIMATNDPHFFEINLLTKL